MLRTEKVSGFLRTSSQIQAPTSNLPPLWIQQAGLEWLFFLIQKFK